MKIAILILVHKYGEYLNRLVGRLSQDFDVFIHADRRFSYFTVLNPRVTIIPERYRSDWGSYRQILATLALFRTANSGMYDRYLLISDQDIPLRSNAEIIKYFSASPDTDFVAHFERDDERELLQDREKLSLYWFLGSRIQYRNKIINIANRIRNKALALLESFVQKSQRLFLLYRPVRERVWGGENWVNLTGRTMDDFITFIDDNPDWLSRFRYTKSADEMLVQMALCNHLSPRKIVNSSLRFVDFTTGPEDPRILRIVDVQRSLSSHGLFARKVDRTVSADFIDAIFSLTECNTIRNK